LKLYKIIDHSYIALTIFFTVYSQLVIRWQVGNAGELPIDWSGKVHYFVVLLVNPWVASAILATFFAGLSWMATMTKFEISYAFPFISLEFIIILLASFFIFGESISISKAIGTFLVCVGLFFLARG